MRAGLEKAKQALEKESADLSADLRSLATSKQDVEHKKKKLEGQLNDLHARFNESERQKAELSERVSKATVSRAVAAEDSCGDQSSSSPPSLPGGAGRCDESAERGGGEEHQAEQRRVRSQRAAPGCSGEAGEQVTSVIAWVPPLTPPTSFPLQELLSEETRQKLNLSGRLRQMEEDRNSLVEQLEEETEAKRAVERQVSNLSMQVSQVRCLQPSGERGRGARLNICRSSRSSWLTTKRS